MKKRGVVFIVVAVVFLLAACGGGFRQELDKQLKDAGEGVDSGREAMLRVLDAEFAKEEYPADIVGTQFGTAYTAALEDGGLKPVPKKFLAIGIPRPIDEMGWSEAEREKVNKIMDICAEYEDQLNFSGWLYVDENFERFPLE